MDDRLRNIHKHMIELGCGSLSHANFLAHFTDMVEMTWNQLSVLQAVHAGEIFLKARLAQEHPLLIFETLPKSTSQQFAGKQKLDFDSLVQSGKTIEYSALPEKLWAATGFRFSEEQLNLYKNLGAVRNSIQHFASPTENVSTLVSRYIYEVIDPFINEHWGLFAVDYCDDTEKYENLVTVLAMRGVDFIIPPTLGVKVESYIQDGEDAYIKKIMKQVKERGYS